MLRVVVIYISVLKGHFLSSLAEIFVILEQGFRASNTRFSKYSDKFQTTKMLGSHGISGKYISEPFSFGGGWKLIDLKLVECHNFERGFTLKLGLVDQNSISTKVFPLPKTQDWGKGDVVFFGSLIKPLKVNLIFNTFIIIETW